MYLQKKGLPEESELVMCTVTKIHYNSVFANLDEYQKPGMIHISEISPGRIRNIRDFTKEGKVIVCKVLRVDTDKGHIDLSLRRVNDSQRRKKVNEMKQEQLAEKIIEFVSRELKLDPKKIYISIYSKVSKEYDYVYNAFQDYIEGGFDLKELKLDDKVLERLGSVIRQRIKPQEVEIKGDLVLESYAPDGIDIVKGALSSAEKVSDKLKVLYEGGGKYRLTVKAKEYKEAENILKEGYETGIRYIEKNGGTGSFVRAD